MLDANKCIAYNISTGEGRRLSFYKTVALHNNEYLWVQQPSRTAFLRRSSVTYAGAVELKGGGR